MQMATDPDVSKNNNNISLYITNACFNHPISRIPLILSCVCLSGNITVSLLYEALSLENNGIRDT